MNGHTGPAPLDDRQHGVGEQVVEWPSVVEPCPQVGARHLEVGNLDVDPGDIVGELDRLARPIDDHQRRLGDDLLEPLPRVQPGGGVVADDREQFGPGIPPGQHRQRVGGVARPTGVDLEASGGQSGDIGDRRLDHRQAVNGRGDRAFPLLLPGNVGDHQDHGVESEGVTDVDGGDEMADVGRIEGPAEQADPGHVCQTAVAAAGNPVAARRECTARTRSRRGACRSANAT